jgi:hypothetical protein
VNVNQPVNIFNTILPVEETAIEPGAGNQTSEKPVITGLFDQILGTEMADIEVENTKAIPNINLAGDLMTNPVTAHIYGDLNDIKGRQPIENNRVLLKADIGSGSINPISADNHTINEVIANSVSAGNNHKNLVNNLVNNLHVNTDTAVVLEDFPNPPATRPALINGVVDNTSILVDGLKSAFIESGKNHAARILTAINVETGADRADIKPPIELQKLPEELNIREVRINNSRPDIITSGKTMASEVGILADRQKIIKAMKIDTQEELPANRDHGKHSVGEFKGYERTDIKNDPADYRPVEKPSNALPIRHTEQDSRPKQKIAIDQKSETTLNSLPKNGSLHQVGVSGIHNSNITDMAGDNKLSEPVRFIIPEAISKPSGNGSHTIRIKLVPEQLGTIRLTLTMNNDVIIGRLIVDNQAALHTVEAHVDQLLNDLAEKGVKVDSFEVALAGGGTGRGTARHRTESALRRKTRAYDNKAEKAKAKSIREISRADRSYVGASGVNLLI